MLTQSQLTTINTKQIDYFAHVINGVKLTVGFDPVRYFNLSNIKRGQYQVKANGYYNKKKLILEPLDWIKSHDGQEHIEQMYSDTENIICASSYHQSIKFPNTIYTKSYYVWLGYLKHCIGNIDKAINAELVE